MALSGNQVTRNGVGGPSLAYAGFTAKEAKQAASSNSNLLLLGVGILLPSLIKKL